MKGHGYSFVCTKCKECRRLSWKRHPPGKSGASFHEIVSAWKDSKRVETYKIAWKCIDRCMESDSRFSCETRSDGLPSAARAAIFHISGWYCEDGESWSRRILARHATTPPCQTESSSRDSKSISGKQGTRARVWCDSLVDVAFARQAAGAPYSESWAIYTIHI